MESSTQSTLRGQPSRLGVDLEVRHAEAADIPALVGLQQAVYPPARFPPVNRWSAGQLAAHQRVFPAGQWVALWGGAVVGAAVTLVGHAAHFSRPHTFLSAIGDVDLGGHDEAGDALYGVDLCVDPRARGRGVGRALYEARFALQRDRGLPWFYAGARIPGYGPLRGSLDAAAYVEDVRRGRRRDPTLGMQLALGFEALQPMPGYLPDPETADYAVLIRRPLSG